MISGSKKETKQQDFTKKVGLFEAKVIAINPSMEEYKDVLGMELKEDSKAIEYLGKSQDGNTTLRLDIWLEEIRSKDKFKVTFFLEDKERDNKDGSKKQYINNVGTCTWADDENNLPEWFTKRDYRVAKVGEEDMYNFLRTWLGDLDYRSDATTLEIEWKKLMKGNLKDLKDQVDGEWCTNVVAMATVKTVIKEDETKSYQSVYNRAFLAPYWLKKIRLGKYSDESIAQLRTKKAKDLLPHERFVISLTGEYGCKDFFFIGDLKEYNPDDNFAESNSTLSDDGGDY